MAPPRETLVCAASGVKALTHMIALRLADMVAGWRERRLAQGGVALAPRAWANERACMSATAPIHTRAPLLIHMLLMKSFYTKEWHAAPRIA